MSDRITRSDGVIIYPGARWGRAVGITLGERVAAAAGFAIGVILALFLVLMVIVAACAPAQSSVQVEPPVVELVPGFRDARCGVPPLHFADQLTIDPATCFRTTSDGGPAACTYVGMVTFDAVMMCAVGLMSEACGKPFVFKQMACSPWVPEYGKYLDDVQARVKAVVE